MRTAIFIGLLMVVFTVSGSEPDTVNTPIFNVFIGLFFAMDIIEFFVKILKKENEK